MFFLRYKRVEVDSLSAVVSTPAAADSLSFVSLSKQDKCELWFDYASCGFCKYYSRIFALPYFVSISMASISLLAT